MSEVDDSDYSLLLTCDSYHLSTYLYTTIPQSTALKKRVAMTLAWIKLAAGSLRGKSNVQKRGFPVVESASKAKSLFGRTLSQEVCRVLDEAGGNVAGDRDPTAVGKVTDRTFGLNGPMSSFLSFNQIHSRTLIFKI